MKKIISIGIIIALMLSVVGCQSGASGKENSDTINNTASSNIDKATSYPNTASQPLESEGGIIKPEIAKDAITETSNMVIKAISDKDAEKLSEYVHPQKGVRFTPYTTVSTDKDVVFSQEKTKNFLTDQNKYIWGVYDGKGDEISLTPSEYYEKFIYSEDFLNAKEIGYNEIMRAGNMVENQFEIYENPIVVEYYFPGFNPDFGGIDWKSLRLVFEQYNNTWKLVGIINNQATI